MEKKEKKQKTPDRVISEVLHYSTQSESEVPHCYTVDLTSTAMTFAIVCVPDFASLSGRKMIYLKIYM